MSTQTIDTPGPVLDADSRHVGFNPTGDPDEALLTIDEVARYLRVPVGTVRKWREKKTGPRARLIGRSLRFRFGDVRAWFDAQPGS
ncbi:MAG: helix-turn-helix domain-containing protein [Curtobacterium sp.]